VSVSVSVTVTVAVAVCRVGIVHVMWICAGNAPVSGACRQYPCNPRRGDRLVALKQTINHDSVTETVTGAVTVSGAESDIANWK